MTTVQRLVQFQYLRILYDSLLSYSTVTCFEILNVYVQQVKSCIVSQVLTLKGFNKYNSVSSYATEKHALFYNTLGIGYRLRYSQLCTCVCARVCVYDILYTLPLSFLFFMHVLHFLQLLTGLQNHLHSFNQSD